MKSDRNYESERLLNVDSAELTESPASHRCRSPAATVELTGGEGGATAEHGGGKAAIQQRRGGGLAAEDGGSNDFRRRRRFPTAARVPHAFAEAKLPEALAASSGLRLRRSRWLWLLLNYDLQNYNANTTTASLA
ncbi:hypothetical protein F2Q70_00031799 [Brassica cretica]|uniref:Uncharacterized protein n=1 Tax=Brassica cretica TaxID=69181 RepID=A0A8S9FHQ1_BRACR|nr:hypothetical protein F2Q70_00031799 [Brassica cretica]